MTVPKVIDPRVLRIRRTLPEKIFWYIRSRVQTIFILRHAEKADGGADPVLSTAGQARAQTLANMLQDANITGLFVTQFQRTQLTGAPTAAISGVNATQYNATDFAGLKQTIRSNFANKNVVIVAHSNTVDDIAAQFGASGVGELDESQFDRLFIIHKSWYATRLLRLRYGTITP